MIVDAHAHVWRRWPYERPVPDPASRGSFENLLFEMDANGVDRALIVSAKIQNGGDNNDYGLAAATAHPDRFVQLVDVDSRWTVADYHQPGAAPRLLRMIEHYRPTGISHYLGPADDGWLSSRDAAPFFAVAAEHELLVSVGGPPVWLGELRRVAGRFPEVTFLVNHLAQVALHPDGVEAALALAVDDEDLPNLLVKVSGLYYGAPRPWDYPFTDRLFIVRCFYEHWGPGRMVWGSDYPSLRPHITYRQSLELLREHAPFLADHERAAILGENLEAVIERRKRSR